MKKWQCVVCGLIYDEAEGWPEDGIEPGTKWEDVPEDWVCPDCGVLSKPALDRLPAPLYLTHMTLVLAQTIELQDRARLRERFYGAARTVLARL